METMTRESWTDERLDDLNGRVGEGFDRIDRKIDHGLREVRGEVHELRSETNARFDRIDARFDSLIRVVAYGAFTMSAAMVGGFVAVLTAV